MQATANDERCMWLYRPRLLHPCSFNVRLCNILTRGRNNLCIPRIVLLLFQRDADELAARAHTGLREQLLQRRFYRALRYLDSFGNLLVGQTLEYEGEHLALPFGESFSFILGTRPALAHRLANQFLVKPHFARHDIADSFGEQCRRVVLSEDAGDTVANQVSRFVLVHAGCDHQDLPRVTLGLGRSQEFCAVALAQVEIEKHKIDARSAESDEGLVDRPAAGNDFEVAVGTEETRHTLAKECMIVQQNNPYGSPARFSHRRLPGPRAPWAGSRQSSTPACRVRATARRQSSA